MDRALQSPEQREGDIEGEGVGRERGMEGGGGELGNWGEVEEESECKEVKVK